MTKINKKTISIVIPVLNEEENLPTLFRALEKQEFTDLEILFVDNGSNDTSAAMIQVWQKKQKKINVSLLEEKKRGYPTPLQRGFRKAKGEYILSLDADCIPHPQWAKEMYTALQDSPLVVGNTENLLQAQASPSEKLAKILFHNYSYNCAHAIGHALPWGPACNLGVKRKVFQAVGSFNESAGAAFDIDWCWRAVLKGYLPSYSSRAKVSHQRKKTEQSFLQQMARYGTGEAWIRNQYDFLLNAKEREQYQSEAALHIAMSGYDRVLQSLPKSALSYKVASAFACGIITGLLAQKKRGKILAPKLGFPISISEKEVRLLVPGKGILELTGDGKQLWDMCKKAKTAKALAKNMHQKFSIPVHDAYHEAQNFLDAIRSGQ